MKRITTTRIRIRILAVVAVLVAGSYSSAGADEVADVDAVVAEEGDGAEPANLDRWSLGLSTGFDVMLQDAHGAVKTNYTGSTADLAFAAEASGSQFFITPMFGVNLELATPALFDLPGRPRVYLGAGIRYVQKLPHFLANEGSKPLPLADVADYFQFPFFTADVNGMPTRTPTVRADGTVDPRCVAECQPRFVAGQGISVEADYGHLYWEAELGVVFTIPLEERAFLIKPAIGYIQQQMDVRGQAHRVFRENGAADNPVGSVRKYTNVEMDQAVTGTFRSIGPKITFELETMEFSKLGQRFGVSIFADAGAFWMISNRTLQFGDGLDTVLTGSFDSSVSNPAQASPITVDYSFGFDKISYQLGIGFKMSWFPL